MSIVAPRSHQNGVTMVELVITIVIISVSLLAVVSVYSNAIQRSADPLIYARSVELGQAYLDEILTKKFDHNTPTGGSPPVSSGSAPFYSASLGHDGPTETATDRSNYNDVDDYDGKTYTSLEFITGDNFNQYTNYQVSIQVNNIDTSASELASLGLVNANVKRIDVTVTNPLGATLTFTGYKGNF